uniref:Chitin-binding type-4 domain-containing protein n=1 Tax=Chromera velia CCMP2878 TaxID=1169474 RepID=A0A0G4GIE3_9ALVE|eukprot:Cvel_22040.t1-p1 / transcript=Cvel_22040.t1 / gene=Cvel_22040 / organism=Chromera_velia_CCMP2878 / gene_product=hypothetical protein / transcript_product=hypothetical protein / location=Cvel_scaffold2128:1481-3510(+) / protein_length=416 / sequence_SO=supercontig / SO=protein_coding / is_pseudo=false
MLKYTLACLLGGVSVSAHVCLLEPRQRGELGLSVSGDHSCYRRTPYCGDVAVESPSVEWKANSRVRVSVQQNFNHWNSEKQGFIDLAVAELKEAETNDEDKWRKLTSWQDFPAWEMHTQTNFTVSVDVPNFACDHCILRVRYVSYNPLEVDPEDNTDAIFYNCADIRIVKELERPSKLRGPRQESETAEAGTEERESQTLTLPSLSLQDEPIDPIIYSRVCTSPPVFSLNCTERNTLGEVTHQIYWDEKALKTRWDKQGAISTTAGTESISLINDYTKPIEYVNLLKEGVCEVSENNKYYPMKFGHTEGMFHRGRGGSDLWIADHRYEHAKWMTQYVDEKANLCIPTAWSHGGHTPSRVVTCDSYSLDPIPASVFEPAPECVQEKTVKFSGCRPEQARSTWMKFYGQGPTESIIVQ